MTSPIHQLPSELGFAMPAEWEQHAATWMCWPFDAELWFNQLTAVQQEYAELVKTIAKFEPVHLLVQEENAAQEFLRDTPNITYHQVPLDDVWFRDNGPIFITQEKSSAVSMVKWEFNSWGEKFFWRKDNQAAYAAARYLSSAHFRPNIVLEGGGIEVNGAGVAMTTKSCLLSKKRNPQCSIDDLERYLHDYLNIKKVLWLEEGLVGDHTDGHIDTITRFVNPTTIVYCITNDKTDKNYEILQKNLALLKGFTDLNGNKFKLIPLILPKNVLPSLDPESSDPLPPTYANFYIGNNFVVVPLYDDPHDAQALATLKPLFPAREVIGLGARAIINGGGAFHCLTQQQPSGTIWKANS